MELLDLTPLYRRFPRSVRLGLDPRMTSWEGTPEADQISGIHLSSFAPSGWEIASNPTQPVDWEAELFTGDHAFCAIGTCNLPTLRWRRVFAIGNHVRWSREGVHIVLPPPDTPSAVAPSDVTSEVLRDGTASGEAYFDALNANVTLEKDGKRLFRYPLLAFRGDNTTSSPGGGGYFFGSPLGMTGKLGWLGAPCMGITGSTVDLVLLSGGLQTLEILGMADPADIEQLIAEGNGELHLGALDRLPVEDSQFLDDKVVFWGLWGEGESQQGLSPPALYGSSSAEIPLQKLGVPSVEKIVPSFPVNSSNQDLLPTLLNNSLPAHLESDVLSVGFTVQTAEAKITALALHAWERVIETSSFGSNVYSYDIAITALDGFARWPGEIVRIAQDIERDLGSETIVLIPGGCLRPMKTVLDSLMCRYSLVVGSVRATTLTILTALQFPRSC